MIEDNDAFLLGYFIGGLIVSTFAVFFEPMVFGIFSIGCLISLIIIIKKTKNKYVNGETFNNGEGGEK